MLSKRSRLTTAEVQGVLAGGRSRRSGTLSLKTLDSAAPFRCAVVVSKKLAKTAVLRNRLRRAAYDALRASSLPPKGHAILFVQSIPPANLRAAFAEDLKKLLHV